MKLIAILTLAVCVALVGCGKEESAASPKQTANDKMAEDIAKIREIKEQEQKAKAAADAKSKQFGRDLVEGAKKPLIEYK
jgi:uncharacterized protein YceK